MHDFSKIRKMLCDELKQYEQFDSISMTSLHVIDTLCHAIKNLDKIMGVGVEAMPMAESDTDFAKASKEVYAALKVMHENAPDEHSRDEVRRMIGKMERL